MSHFILQPKLTSDTEKFARPDSKDLPTGSPNRRWRNCELRLLATLFDTSWKQKHVAFERGRHKSELFLARDIGAISDKFEKGSFFAPGSTSLTDVQVW